MPDRKLMLIAGNANPQLAKEISSELATGICDARVGTFGDGEVRVRIHETVRGADVFVLQSTCPPVNDNLMELLILIDALRRASARKVIAVVPYYGYGRQDRKDIGRVPISARLVANMIETAGADRVLTMDLHVGQIQGFFNIPVDNLRSDFIFAEHMRSVVGDMEDIVIVAPDVGATGRARLVAEGVDVPLAVLEKRRSQDGQSVKVFNVIGDVAGKRAVLIDDMVASGGTLVKAAEILLENGATEVSAYCTHGVFSGDAVSVLEASPLKRVVVTNTITNQCALQSDKIHYVSVGGHLAKTIRQVFEDRSVSLLFPHY
ncbi:ribose-phosphate pyrophosphokinase [Candidatus Bipolaricaulota bacterium]|jgi:ribose-phosphate pyrophosphokinase|nr:ribose-phosphate pyrophosphokinase [Candidatus Bipolaricaulota bacterium]